MKKNLSKYIFVNKFGLLVFKSTKSDKSVVITGSEGWNFYFAYNPFRR